MLFYTAVFFSSFLFLLFGKFKKIEFFSKISIIIGLLIPIIFSGIRKIGVGTDTLVYVNGLTQSALSADSFREYLNGLVFMTYKYQPISDFEIGYNFILYYSTKILGSQGILLVTQSIIVLCVYFGLKPFVEEKLIPFAMLIFYFLYLGTTLNAMRQWIAISILFLFSRFLVNKKIGLFLLGIFISYLFHRSAIIGLFYLLIYIFMEKDSLNIFNAKIRINNWKVKKLLAISILSFLSLLFIQQISEIMLKLGPVFARYSTVYLSGNLHFLPFQILQRLPLIIVMMLGWSASNSKYKFSGFVYLMCVIEIFISQLGSIYNQSSRIGYYFAIFNIVLIPMIISSCNVKRGMLIKYFMYAYVLIYFYYNYVYQGYNQIVPYLFFWD